MQWICADCAKVADSVIPADRIATWHLDFCDVCREKRAVTEPRDFSPRADRHPVAAIRRRAARLRAEQ